MAIRESSTELANTQQFRIRPAIAGIAPDHRDQPVITGQTGQG